MAKKLSKFFRVAVEGATVDGRTIDRDWISQMAETYSPTTYGARINIEHLKSYAPDSTFKAYGDVVALKAEEVEIGGKKKLALFAQVEPTDDLVKMVKARQKIYTSVEVSPKFADSGKAYLVGLAVTDSPASLGTEMLAFSAQQGDKSPLAGRKQDPANHFSEALEAAIELEDEPSEGTSLFAKVKDMLGLSKKQADAQLDDVRKATELLAETTAKAIDLSQAADTAAKAQASTIAKLSTDLAALQAKLDKLPAAPAGTTGTPGTTPGTGTQNHGARPPATGGTGNSQVMTDC